jgi:hypothetical protein
MDVIQRISQLIGHISRHHGVQAAHATIPIATKALKRFLRKLILGWHHSGRYKEKLRSKLPMAPKFESLVGRQLEEFIAQCITEQDRLSDFVPRRIHISSRRLDRYFDPSLHETLDSSIRELLNERLWPKASEGLEEITLSKQISLPQNDTLYLICLNLVGGEIGEVRRIRATTNSLVIGWFWDNHHNHHEHMLLAKELDICIPAHHYGSEFLRFANIKTTSPMPLCCTQWSANTLQVILDKLPLENANKTPIIFGRFTFWDVGARRNDLVQAYGLGTIDPVIQLVLEHNEDYAYFHMSSIDRFCEWRKSLFSLCIPVRSDLPLRFFDAMATGNIPLVDTQVASSALADLAPSLIAGRDYILVDAANPSELLAARHNALLSNSLQQRSITGLQIQENHLIEHRFALVCKAFLLATSVLSRN